MKKILIIEDDSQIQTLYQKKLIRQGLVVLQATDGQEGLTLAKQNKPDLILLDIMLPGKMNGFDVLETLKKDRNLYSIPVVMLTNLDTEEKVARSIGAVDYIVKANISIEEVVKKVKKYLK